MNIPSTPIKRMHVSHAHHSPSHLISQHGSPQRKRITGVSAGMCHISSHLITSHHGTSHHNTLHLIACHITNDLITLHYTTFIITCSYPILSCLVLSSYRITFHILSPLCHRMFVVLCPSPHITSTAIISYPLPMPSYDVPCASYHLTSSHLISSNFILYPWHRQKTVVSAGLNPRCIELHVHTCIDYLQNVGLECPQTQKNA